MKARTRLWIKKHEGFLNCCGYDKDHIWVGSEYLQDFQKFIKDHFCGDFINITCTLQEDAICIKWEDLMKFI